MKKENLPKCSFHNKKFHNKLLPTCMAI